MKKILVGFLLFLGSISYGQSVTGTSGLIHIPSARMLEDGQLVLGAAYIPKPYFTYVNRGGYLGGTLRNNPGLNTYITYAILPFAEIMFRYTHELNMSVNPFNQYFPDRMFSARIRIIKESDFLPSIVFGVHDIGKVATTFGSATNFSTNYLTFTKRFKFLGFNSDLSFGYAFDFLTLKAIDIQGFFGGVEFTPFFYNKASFMIEYDSKVFNSGVKWRPINSINIMVGLWDLNKPTFSFNYQF